MTAVTFALLTSLFWGAADFLGGMASRRAAVGLVVLTTQIAGALALLLVVLVQGATPPQPVELLVGAAAGLSGAAAIATLYRGLSQGVVSIVMPVATASALIPVAVGLGRGERPGTSTYLGMAAILAGVALVSITSSSSPIPRSQVRFSVVSGLTTALGIGGFLVALDASAPADPYWTLLAARTTATLVTAAVVVSRLRGSRPPAAVLALAVAGGVLDVAANALFIFATRAGMLSIVAVLASLYPAVTVLLARTWLRERVTRFQDAGLLVALFGAALTALPS